MSHKVAHLWLDFLSTASMYGATPMRGGGAPWIRTFLSAASLINRLFRTGQSPGSHSSPPVPLGLRGASVVTACAVVPCKRRPTWPKANLPTK
jgi:hypothetical protein